MITDRRKFITKLTLYWMSSFHFTVRINSKFFPCAVRSVQETYLPKSATFDVRYCVLKPMVGYAALLVLPGDRYMEEKQTELETENKLRGR